MAPRVEQLRALVVICIPGVMTAPEQFKGRRAIPPQKLMSILTLPVNMMIESLPENLSYPEPAILMLPNLNKAIL